MFPPVMLQPTTIPDANLFTISSMRKHYKLAYPSLSLYLCPVQLGREGLCQDLCAIIVISVSLLVLLVMCLLSSPVIYIMFSRASLII